uniref:Leucine zipper putative tumor suppressor 2 n=1 Tax=Cacopsylla melanoneura TaxID=428564 RepID=A0A8D9DYA2_9HEMI
MARIDSGHETLFSEDSSPCEGGVSPSSNLGSGSSGSSGTGLETTPPKLSATLSKGKVVLRPVAFKPVSVRFSNHGERYGSTPALTRPGSQITCYGSSSDIRHSNLSMDRKMASASPLTMSSLPFSPSRSRHRIGYDSYENVATSSLPSHFLNDHRPRSNTLERPKSGTLERPKSGTLDRPKSGTLERPKSGTLERPRSGTLERPKSGALDRPRSGTLDRPGSKASSFRLVQPSSTPSNSSCADLTRAPSTEIVSDLESALRERDYELAYLRQTMEHNEQVIFRVYQDKERAWDREMKRLKVLHESRLRTGAQKSLKLEQMLMMQTYQGDQTFKSHELIQLRTEIRDLQLELDEKNKEISKLKRDISEIQDHHDAEETELKLIIQQLQHKMSQKYLDESTSHFTSKPTSPSSDYHSLDNISSSSPVSSPVSKFDYEKLKEELGELQMKLYREQSLFQREKVIWAEEKEKVLKYQRQLQLNYVQMLRRSKHLETQLENLSLELDLNRRTKKPLQTSISHTAIHL